MYFFNFDLDNTSTTLTQDLLDEIKEIDQKFDPAPWPPLVWEELREQELDALFIFTQNETVIGFANFKLSREESLAHLLKVLIIPSKRRKGLGLKLLKMAFETLQGQGLSKVYLEVEKGNPAFLIYEKLGLKKIHEIADFYGAGRPALVMIME